MKRRSFALRDDELSELVARSPRELGPGSPLAPFADPSVRRTGRLAEPWVGIVDVLADPDHCARVLVCTPRARLNVVAYRRRGSPWVGFFPQAGTLMVEAGLDSAALARTAGSWFPAGSIDVPAMPDLTGAGLTALLSVADVARRSGSVVVGEDDARALVANPPLSTLTGRVIDLSPWRCAPRPDWFDAGLEELRTAHLVQPTADGISLAPAVTAFGRTADPEAVAMVQVTGSGPAGPLAGHTIVFGGEETTWRLQLEGLLGEECEARLEPVTGGRLLTGLYTMLESTATAPRSRRRGQLSR